jgi:hypothetical protein
MRSRALCALVIAVSAGFAAPRVDAGKPPRINAVPLIVTLDGNPTDLGSPYNIRSDGNGPYENGVAGVAVIDNPAPTISNASSSIRSFTGLSPQYYFAAKG